MYSEGFPMGQNSGVLLRGWPYMLQRCPRSFAVHMYVRMMSTVSSIELYVCIHMYLGSIFLQTKKKNTTSSKRGTYSLLIHLFS